MIPFGSVMLLLVTVFIGLFAAIALVGRFRRRAASAPEALPLERALPRIAAIAHAILFTGYWAVLLYQHLLPSPWGDPNVLILLGWLPLFVIHMVAQFWLEARARFTAQDTTHERAIYREGYADGRRDALNDSLVRLTDEGELVDDYPLPAGGKRKRHADDPLAE